jgi:transposase
MGADHRYVPILMTAPGIGWILADTIAAEIGDIDRFPTPKRLVSYTGLCRWGAPSGDMDLRGRLSKHGPRYLRWALIDAAAVACRHPVYTERYQQRKHRVGRQRGAKVAQIDLARRLTAAIWHMLTRHQPFTPFAPADAPFPLAAPTALQ